jgi:hypothetical protein
LKLIDKRIRLLYSRVVGEGMGLFVAASVAAGMLSTAVAKKVPCVPVFEEVGASFDLSALTLKNMNYHVMDSEDSVLRNYTYVFNVCAPVGQKPSLCDDVDKQAATAPAYQISQRENWCFRLGNTEEDLKWGLVDEDEPSTGIKMTYHGGDACPDFGGDVTRKLSVNFLCAPELGMQEFEEEKVTEEKCHYSLSIKSIFGCPQECPVAKNRALCAGHGKCGYDTDAKRPRCFCEIGWQGADCGEAVDDSSGIDGVGVLLIFLLLILGALFVAGVMLFLKLQKLTLKKEYLLDDVDREAAQIFSIAGEDDGDAFA